MQFNMQRRLLLILIAVLALFIGGRWNVPLAAWLAPICMLRFFRTSTKPWRDGILLWLVSTLPVIVSWNGATFMAQIHPIAEAIFFLVVAPIGLIPYLLDRAYTRRFGASILSTLVFPIALTATDFFSSGGSPIGTFGAVAYSQRDALPIMQLAAFTGLWGITFLIGWTASLTVSIWEQRFRPTRPMLAAICILALIPALGLSRLLLAPQTMPVVQVGGFSLPEGQLTALLTQAQSGDQAAFRREVEALHERQLDQIRTLAHQGAQIVVLQEGAGLGYTDQVQRLLTNAGALAREEQIYIVLPTVTFGGERLENAVRIIDPSGAIVLNHIKYGGNQFEGSVTGDGILQTVDTPYGKLSAVICWDADFPDIIRQAGAQDVALLFIPSNDWIAVKDIHAGMATFRAVENGLAIYRQTGQGVSVVTDAYGRTHNRIDLFAERSTAAFAAVHVTSTPIAPVQTMYPVIGDSVGAAMLVGLLGLLIGLLVIRIRPALQALNGKLRSSV